MILDVVYNHTGEGKEKDYHFHFRALTIGLLHGRRKRAIPRLHGLRQHAQRQPPGRQQLILDSLRYWASEMQVDGFRFDLAATFVRDTQGKPMNHPPSWKPSPTIRSFRKKSSSLKPGTLPASTWWGVFINGTTGPSGMAVTGIESAALSKEPKGPPAFLQPLFAEKRTDLRPL